MKNFSFRKVVVYLVVVASISIVGVNSAVNAIVTPTEGPDSAGYISPTFKNLNVQGNMTVVGDVILTGLKALYVKEIKSGEGDGVPLKISDDLVVGDIGAPATGGIMMSNWVGPVLTSRMSLFSDNCPPGLTTACYKGLGMWGLFLEWFDGAVLTLGILNNPNASFKVKAFNSDSTFVDLLTVNNSGDLYTKGKITAGSELRVTTDATVVGKLTAFSNLDLAGNLYNSAIVPGIGVPSTELPVKILDPDGVDITGDTILHNDLDVEGKLSVANLGFLMSDVVDRWEVIAGDNWWEKHAVCPEGSVLISCDFSGNTGSWNFTNYAGRDCASYKWAAMPDTPAGYCLTGGLIGGI